MPSVRAPKSVVGAVALGEAVLYLLRLYLLRLYLLWLYLLRLYLLRLYLLGAARGRGSAHGDGSAARQAAAGGGAACRDPHQGATLTSRCAGCACSLLTTHCSLLTTHYSLLLTNHHSLITTHHSRLTTPTAHSTDYSLLAGALPLGRGVTRLRAGGGGGEARACPDGREREDLRGHERAARTAEASRRARGCNPM